MLNEILTPNWLLIYGGLGLILAELFVGIETGFDLVLIGTTLIVGGGVGNFTDNWQLGLATTFTLAVLYVIFGRQYVKNRLSAEAKPSNVDALIGQTGVVTKAIAPNAAGRVKISSEEWRAMAETEIASGRSVTIQKFKGVTASVIESNST